MRYYSIGLIIKLVRKKLSFNIYKTPIIRYIVEYLGCCPQGVEFQLPELIQTFQAAS